MRNNNSEDELTLAEIYKITKNYKNATYVSFSGGEPFMREDIPDICEYFCKLSNTKFFSIPTNCLLPDQIFSSVEKILKKCPSVLLQIELSLDGIGKNHDLIRGVSGNFEKFLITYKKLVVLREKYNNLKIKVNTTASRLNQMHLNNIMDFVNNSMAVDCFSVTLLHGEPHDPKTCAADINLYKQMSDTLYKKETVAKKTQIRYLLFKVLHSICRDTIIKSVIKNKMIQPCMATKKLIVINEEGNVFPCESLFNCKLGSLREVNYDIKKILKSNYVKKLFINQIRKNKCFCSWSCAVLVNTIFYPKFYPVILYRLIKLFSKSAP